MAGLTGKTRITGMTETTRMGFPKILGIKSEITMAPTGHLHK